MAESARASILIAGVRKALAEKLSSAFRAKGWNASIAEDGAEAISEARKRSFEILIAGESSRWMSPLELARRILSLSPKVACLLLTKPEEEGGTSSEEARSAGFAKVFLLSVDPAEILKDVEKLSAVQARQAEAARQTEAREKPPAKQEKPPAKQSFRYTRRHPRVPLETLVHYQSDDHVHADPTRNVSLGGIFIETRHVIRPGTPLTIKLSLPGGKGHPVLVPARVVRLQTPSQPGNGPPGLGVEFLALDPEAREALGAYVRALGPPDVPQPAATPAPAPPSKPKARMNISFRSPETFLREYSRNISFNGMFLKTTADKLLEQGTVLELRIELPGNPEPLFVKGEVVSIEKGEAKGRPLGMAIQFLPECAGEVRALHAFARTHRPGGGRK